MDGRERPNRPRELALERPSVEHTLLELCRSEPQLVEALEANAATARQAGRHQVHASLGDLRVGNRQRESASLDAVRDLELLELADDARSILAIKLREQNGIGLVRLAVREDGAHQNHERHRRCKEDPRSRANRNGTGRNFFLCRELAWWVEPELNRRHQDFSPVLYQLSYPTHRQRFRFYAAGPALSRRARPRPCNGGPLPLHSGKRPGTDLGAPARSVTH